MPLRNPTTRSGLVTAHSAVDRWAESRPAAVAVRDAESVLTWAELRTRVTDLAAALVADHGVRRGDVVGVCAGRGVDAVVGVLAVLRAGGAFLPLDPAAPLERLERVVTESDVDIVLADAGSPALDGVERVALSGTGRPSGDVAFPEVGLDDLAYVVYTSGSTGTPKGVLVPHRGIANLVATHVDLLGLGPDDVALNFAAMTFDGFVFELFVPLGAGATVVLPDEETRLDPARLTRLIADTGVTFAPIPPSLLAALPAAELPTLRSVLVAGDTCRLDVARRWARGRVLFNSYGPTEATVSATLARFTDTVDRLHIGSAFANVDVHLLDDDRRPVEPGAIGEIHIGGVGVAWGYLKRPAMTAERFVPDPFSPTPGGRMYRTGDLARLRADGEIDFAGRRDRQVKVRGIRVEPAEIEAALVATPDISEAITVPRADAAGEIRLIAYVTATPKSRVDPVRVRAALTERLPRGHVPDLVVVLDEMPRNAARKIDAERLPDPVADTASVPLSEEPVERLVADIVAETLGVPAVPTDTKFFDLGGNSLLMMRVVAQVNELFDAEVSVREFATASTVAGLAAVVRRTAEPDRLAAVVDMAEQLTEISLDAR